MLKFKDKKGRLKMFLRDQDTSPIIVPLEEKKNDTSTNGVRQPNAEERDPSEGSKAPH